MSSCKICTSNNVEELLDLGNQPITNRFLENKSDKEFSFPMRFGICTVCGTAQLLEIAPCEELAPRFEWLTYNEPERHLADMAKRIRTLPDLPEKPTVCGVSFKDDPLIDRLCDLGFSSSWRIDLELDLDCTLPGAGVETVQSLLTEQCAESLATAKGSADVVVARHIYEHAHDMYAFQCALRALVKPGGYIVFELPDCTKQLDSKDYCMLWEEHAIYFTPATFTHGFSFSPFTLVDFFSYEYPIENVLVGITQTESESIHNGKVKMDLQVELARAREYADGYKDFGSRVRTFLESRAAKGRIAMFGAGHFAATYINLFGLDDLIDCVIDDHPNKNGMLMPGSQLPIRGSETLIKDNIMLCLLSLSPASEEKVRANNQGYLNAGGKFYSIFPSSPNHLEV